MHDGLINMIAVNPVGNWVATAGSQTERICLWRPETGRMIASIDSAGTTPMSVAFSADGKSLAYGTESLDALSLHGQLKQEYQAEWDYERFEFLWGLFRSSKVIRPLNAVFDLT